MSSLMLRRQTARWTRVRLVAAMLTGCALQAGCGTYVEPKPGVYLGYGHPQAELTCEYAAPTAMRISTWQCRRTGDIEEESRRAQEMLDRTRIYQPRDPI